MLFPEFDFLCFFLFVLVFNWFFKKWNAWWQIFLLASSYLFYYFFAKTFLLLLIFITLINYFLGFLNFNKALYEGKRKNLFLMGAIVFQSFHPRRF